MKLRNKKTGEIRDFIINKDKIQTASAIDCWEYNSLAELNEEWEDYEEPKEYWYINCYGEVLHTFYNGNEWDERRKLIGNFFETKEEAELAVRKLKAWKRLKDKGFKFKGISGYDEIHFWFPNSDDMFENSDTRKDLDLLFSGGEE